ncbi:MAG TPA: methyltransferase domain-containing protein [Solirubrobacteraceae bacterium]
MFAERLIKKILRRNRRIDALVSERRDLRVARGILQLQKGELEAVVRGLTQQIVHPAAPRPPTNPSGHIPSSVPCSGQAYREYLTRQICSAGAPAIVGLADRGEYLQVCVGRHGPFELGPGWTVLDLLDPAPVLDGDGALPAEWERRFALALCNAVLEHIPDPRKAVAELHRVLAPGGYVYLEMAFWQPYRTFGDGQDGVGGDFWRATVDGLRIWAAGFQELSSGWADEGVVYFFGRKPAEASAA